MERMELDIGSLIYILITIVAVVAGIAKKKKKPAEEGAPATDKNDNSKVGFFGKLEKQLESFAVEAKGSVEKLKDEFIPGETTPKEVEYAEVDERDYFEKLNDDYEAGGNDDLQGNFAKYEGIFSPDEEENFELVDSDGISVSGGLEIVHLEEEADREIFDLKVLEEFDARTAVIYSSIINRIEI